MIIPPDTSSVKPRVRSVSDMDPFDLLSKTLEGVRVRKGQDHKFTALCPAHADTNQSLSVTRGNTRPVVIRCHTGCDTRDVLRHLGLTYADISGRPKTAPTVPYDEWMPCGADGPGNPYDTRHRKTAEYRYHDADGRFVFAVARCARKGQEGAGCAGFGQWRPNPEDTGKKRWSLDGAGDGLPYRLPEVLAAHRDAGAFQPVLWIVEGEKDADRLAAMHYTVTTNAGGAGAWTQAHADHFAALHPDVMIIADRDDAGRTRALHVADTFLNTARTIEVVRAAVDKRGADVADHLEAGHRMHELITVCTPLHDRDEATT